jgi:hypothetical protein
MPLPFGDCGSMSALSLPLPVRHAIESGRAVLFLGAGIGFNAHGPDGSKMPLAQALAKDICGSSD